MNTALLEGRVAIVTGGGRGLGQAMTLGLARAGASVVISAAREVHEIGRVADEINVMLGSRRVLGRTGGSQLLGRGFRRTSKKGLT
ncbi:SDR family NAD(P)-dependent oxidoreductase [Pseudarthrobacter sp. NPDC058119]|uniref:SDR family NAD(P)-dependent oxidoreductase n=1 Tax=Pseudarthrobacter sp. NPDC058119 TaxID=3346348 RepID=UPI0036DAE92C